MSDEFILGRQTFCVILDRKEIFEISNYVFFHNWSRDHPRHGNVGNRLANRMEALQIRAGPASGRNCPLKSQNLGFGHIGTFFQSLRKFAKWGVPKKKLAIQSELFLGG